LPDRIKKNQRVQGQLAVYALPKLMLCYGLSQEETLLQW